MLQPAENGLAAAADTFVIAPKAQWRWDGDHWERRSRLRLKLSYVLRLQRSGDARVVEAETVNINTRGFYFRSAARFLVDESLSCEIAIPGYEQGASCVADLVLRGRARVVRVERLGESYGVACSLDTGYTVAESNSLEFAGSTS